MARSSDAATAVGPSTTAGSDVQATYLSKKLIEQDEERDPLVYSAALLVEQGILSEAQILDIYNDAVLTTTATYDYEPRTLQHRHLWFDDHDAKRTNDRGQG